jgi:O-antigen ligase
MNKKLSTSNIIFIVLAIISFVGLQLFILKKTTRIEVIIGINGALLLLFLIYFITKKIANILVCLYFVPLLFLNNAVHYQLKYELFFGFPIFILLFSTVALNILNTKKENSGNYISKPILVFLLYFFLLGFWGFLQGYASANIFFELYHFLLFGSIALFRYNLTSREDYHTIFKFILSIFLLISFEYIILGFIVSGDRFVTFQSGFLPLMSGVVFASYLFAHKKINKYITAFILIVIILAMFSTLTRSLWGAAGITLLVTYILYLWASKRLTFVKKVIIGTMFILTIGFVLISINSSKSNESMADDRKGVEYRAKSIANPTEDYSFLMRVELGWYALQKFYERPIFGWGLGDILRYKYLGDSKLQNRYIDNSWFYFLWKGGIIGIFLIGFIFYRSIKVGIIIISKTENAMVKSIVVGIISGIIGLIALGFLSPLIIKYRTNIIFPLLWGYLEFEYNNLNANIKENVK